MYHWLHITEHTKMFLDTIKVIILMQRLNHK